MGENLREYCVRYDRSELLLQWHPEKNGVMTPDRISYGSQKKIWWVCDRGHEWQAPIYSRATGHGCPVCTGKLVIPGENDLQSYDAAVRSAREDRQSVFDAAMKLPLKNIRGNPKKYVQSSKMEV